MAMAGLLLGGCGRSVLVSPPEVSAEVGAACAAASEALPDTLAGQPRVETVPDPALAAAWGAPAIVWRCGAPVPGSFTKASQLLEVDGVDWYPEPLSRGSRFTAVRSDPVVELTVPDAYANPAGVIAELQSAAEDG
jgi:hypothetical protein